MFLGAISYFAFYIYDGLTSPYRTVVALRYTADEGMSVSGFIVRNEFVVKSYYPIVDVTVSDGEKIAAGQVIASAYYDEDSLSRQIEIRGLMAEIAQLSAILNADVTSLTMARAETSRLSIGLDGS